MTDDETTGTPWIRLRFEGDPRPGRRFCDKCEEPYLPENLTACISCGDMLCYQCSELAVKMGEKLEMATICRYCKLHKPGWWNDGKTSKPNGFEGA